MKRSAIFINVGRGPIVVEQDLYEALENGEIAAAVIGCAQRRTDEQRESACKDQRQQQTVDHTTHRMGKCGSKNPLNEDHRGADQGIFSSVEIIVNK